MEKKRLKIMFFVDTFYPVVGGLARTVDRSATFLSQYADVTVVCVEHPTYVDKPVPYKILRCKGFYNKITKDGMANPMADKNLINEILFGEYDLFHCHSCGNFFDFARRMSKKLGIPMLSTMHTLFYYDVKRYVKIPLLAKFITHCFFKKTGRSDYIWAVSDFCRKALVKSGIKKPILTMHNAIDYTPKNTNNMNFAKLEKDLGIDCQTKVFSFVSRIEKNKNVDLIVSSVNHLFKTKPQMLENTKFLVVGDGSYLEHTKKSVEKLGLEHLFVFTGMVSDKNKVAKYYARSNLVLFPSYADSCGLIQIEASAYQKPTLVLKGFAPCDKIIDGYNGFSCMNTVQDFCAKLEIALTQPQKLQEVGKMARKTLFRTYKSKAVLQEMMDSYNFAIEDFKSKNASKNFAKSRQKLKKKKFAFAK